MVVDSRPDRPVVVSIATIPSRIAHLKPTLDSLLQGELSPNQIYINFPEYCVLQKSYYTLPDFLIDESYKGDVITVNQIDRDWGPGTKLLGPVDLIPGECYFVIADDDIIYHRSFLKNLLAEQQYHHDRAFSYYTYNAMGMPVGQGCDGVSMWSPHLAGVRNFAMKHVADTSLVYHDDIWISFFLASKGVEISRVPVPADATLVYEQNLPNNVLQALDGNLARDRIVKENLPRLFSTGMIPAPLLRRFKRRHMSEFIMDISRRAQRKILKPFNKEEVRQS